MRTRLPNFLRKLLTPIYRLSLETIDRCLATKPRSQQPTVALIRLDAIGDFILWLDSAKRYRTAFPRHHLTLIANSLWADLARHLPYWDEVLVIDVRRLIRHPWYRWRSLSTIRNMGFEIAIQPTYSRVLLQGDSIIRATGASLRIGSSGNFSNITLAEKVLADSWYTQLIPATDAAMHELERNAEFISGLTGIDVKASIPAIPRLTTSRQYIPETDYFIVFPGASWNGRQWPLTHFAHTICQIVAQYGLRPILCGSATEQDLCCALANQLNCTCDNMAGQTSLAELVELIRTAHLLISNETSAIHIAAAVGTPSICILGGGHYGRFMPYTATMPGIKPLAATYPMPCYGCNWKCTQPHLTGCAMPCVANVSTAHVLQLAQTALQKRAK